jgi:hypothetical protein
VEGKVVEKDVDRNAVPEQSRLAVALDLLDVGEPNPDALGHRREGLLRVGGVAEDVDVEIARPTRLLDAVGQREGAAEGMGQGGGCE